MKRGQAVFLISVLFLFSITFVSAAACDLTTTLLNQDPYPAVPGDYVELVFQVDGLEGNECDDITFTLQEDYPLNFDPGEDGVRVFSKVDYIKDFESNLLIPFEVRVDENALDGKNPFEAIVHNKGDAAVSTTFDLEVEDVRADFEVYVKEYSVSTKELTLEVLNIEGVDIEALTIYIPKQEGVEVKGSNRIVVGDLDSNEYTSADFEATIADGEFTVDLIYSDTINERRTIQKEITFDSSYFTNRAADQKTTPTSSYVVGAIIIVVILYYVYHRRKKKKAREKHGH